MDNTDKEFQKLLNLASQHNSYNEDTSSLSSLYELKKEQLKLNDTQIQKILGMDKNTLKPILDGTAKRVDIINVIKLSHFLDLSVDELLKLYIPGLEPAKIGHIQRAKEAAFIVANFDTASLVKMNFFSAKLSVEEMGNKIKKFFGLETIYQYPTNEIFPLYSKAKKNANELNRDFWVRSAHTQFKYINNPNKYNRESLIDILPKIRPYSRDIKTGLIKVLKALYNIGITVIYQPTIEKLQIRGATFACNGKPCIVLSGFQNNYPTLWFALLHELFHVLYDFEEISKTKYHLSDTIGDLFLLNEEKADKFAQEYLLSEDRYKFVIPYINSKVMIDKYAFDWGVHPSIIYIRHCYVTNKWAFYKKYIPPMDEAISVLNTHPFNKESLMESAKQIKELIYNI